jgi:prophage regulatory protein
MESPNAQERLLPPAVVMDRTSLSRTTLWRLVRAGKFPAPIQVSAGRVAWSETALQQWIASKIAQPARAA